MLKTQNNIYPTIWVVISALGFFVILLSCKYGIGLSPDSKVYLETAENIARGTGLFYTNGDGEPLRLTHYPPLYPISLAIFGKILGENIFLTAHILSATLFAASIIVIGIISKALKLSNIYTILVTIIVSYSGPMLSIYTKAWSETLFILVLLLIFWLLLLFGKNKKIEIFYASAVAVGIAPLVRYVGIVLIPFGSVLVFASLRTKSNLSSIKYTVIWSLIAVFPSTLWVIYNKIQANNLTNRTFSKHIISRQDLAYGLSTFEEWFLPGFLDTNIKHLVTLSAFSLLVFIFYKTKPGRHTSYFIALVVIFTTMYISMLVTSISFFDAHTVLDYRMLSPLYPIITITILFVLFQIISKNSSLLQKVVAMLGVSYLLIFNFKSAHSYLTYNHKEGYLFRSRLWKESPTIDEVKHLVKEREVYSNGYDVIYLTTGINTYSIPSKIDPKSKKETSSSQKIQRIEENLHVGKVYVIYFKNIDWRYYLYTKKDLEQHFALNLYKETKDGSIYELE